MKLLVAAIGHLKPGPERDLAADYESRIRSLGRKAGISDLTLADWPESKLADPQQRGRAEAQLLWSAVPERTPVCVLDERGESLASAAFAQLLEKQAAAGTRQLTFMIGGPDGHSPDTRSKALKILSFGPMTWPHRLVRVMLLEQIYRAVTIMVNHPYHRV